MINRRIIRIKAMQTIYAFKQNEESDYNLALDVLSEDFRMELNRIGKHEYIRINQEKELAIQLFRSMIPNLNALAPPEEIPEKAREFAESAFALFKSRKSKDLVLQKRYMVEETESIYRNYLRLLRLLLELADLGDTPGLSGNLAIECLRSSTEIQRICQQGILSWDVATVKQWARILKKDSDLVASLVQEEKNFETDRDTLRLIVRDFFFTNEVILGYFEENDLKWEENKSIIRSLVNHTIKQLNPDDCESSPLTALSKNWEDDKEFLIKLFDLYFVEEEESERIIAEKSQKWAIDRIALLDKILMKMAMSEMIHFANIPVKVTINEYIDISKTYSTPKSWKYINGMLDEISKRLLDSGKVRKSGRGLIDNK